MHLAEFIRDHMEDILVEWEAFAATNTPAASTMSPLELRDHGKQILQAIATDIATAQSDRAQKEKSLGQAPSIANAPETAAETHAVLRGQSGFNINQLIAEYRALRASVLRLWEAANDEQRLDLDDIMRFNEAVDQALAESVSIYTAQVDHARKLFLATVGHDMRGPLNTIALAVSLLARLKSGEELAATSQHVLNSTARLSALLDDLVDFNRAQLGLGIPVHTAPVDLADSFSTEIEELRFAHPENTLELDIDGDVSGSFDERRLQQALSNLVLNAVKYGPRKGPISVRLSGDEHCVNFEVMNKGSLDAGVSVQSLFEPLRRGANAEGRRGSDSMGLGLYIAREIAIAHGGQIDVHAHPASTAFSVSLPRTQACAPSMHG